MSLVWGMSDEVLTLAGFGMDSLIEVVSATGVAHMIVRLRYHGPQHRDHFERTALRITGLSFYGLAVALGITVLWSIMADHRPESTTAGIVVSTISIAVMGALIVAKSRIGITLQSEPIIADAQCSRVCLYMSIVLLLASVMYSISGIGYVDAAGAAVLAWFSVREANECFRKAQGKACSDSCCS